MRTDYFDDDDSNLTDPDFFGVVALRIAAAVLIMAAVLYPLPFTDPDSTVAATTEAAMVASDP